MDTETISIISIVFGTPVTIVAIVCTYNLLKHWIDRRMPREASPPKSNTGIVSSDELALKAANLQRRLSNLEEILQSEKQNGGTA